MKMRLKSTLVKIKVKVEAVLGKKELFKDFSCPTVQMVIEVSS